ncbi:MAG: hypothetical protein ACREO4_06225 [Lysobacter sp.]
METIFAVIDAGVVVNTVVADEWEGGVRIDHLDPRPGIGWSYDGTTFSPPAAPVPDPETRHVTRLAFRNRFTQVELVTLEIAALDDPAASMDQRQQAAAIRVMMRQVDNANYVDLDRPDTRGGVEQLEAGGLLALGRALEILDAPVQPDELPS